MTWPTDPVDHADDYMSAQEDDWEAEFERLAFLEETAGMDSVDVYRAKRPAAGEEGVE